MYLCQDSTVVSGRYYVGVDFFELIQIRFNQKPSSWIKQFDSLKLSSNNLICERFNTPKSFIHGQH